MRSLKRHHSRRLIDGDGDSKPKPVPTKPDSLQPPESYTDKWNGMIKVINDLPNKAINLIVDKGTDILAKYNPIALQVQVFCDAYKDIAKQINYQKKTEIIETMQLNKFGDFHKNVDYRFFDDVDINDLEGLAAVQLQDPFWDDKPEEAKENYMAAIAADPNWSQEKVTSRSIIKNLAFEKAKGTKDNNFIHMSIFSYCVGEDEEKVCKIWQLICQTNFSLAPGINVIQTTESAGSGYNGWIKAPKDWLYYKTQSHFTYVDKALTTTDIEYLQQYTTMQAIKYLKNNVPFFADVVIPDNAPEI